MRDPFVKREPEVSINLTCTNLARRLQEAADAHHKYEATLGASDPDWPVWYATYIDLSLRSILVTDGKGGYRGLTQEELIEQVKHDLARSDDPFKATVAREIKQAEEFEAGKGVVAEGHARRDQADFEEHFDQVVTPLTITCNEGEAVIEEVRQGMTGGVELGDPRPRDVSADILTSLRHDLREFDIREFTCGTPAAPSTDLGLVEEDLREEERDRVAADFVAFEDKQVVKDATNDPSALEDAFRAGEEWAEKHLACGGKQTKVGATGHL